MKLPRTLFAAIMLLVSVQSASADTSDLDRSKSQTGIASYYSEARNNLPTASGEREDPNALTAAHWTLPLGSWVKVTNLFNGRTIAVKINDRNAPSQERIIDLSRAAAKAVGMMAMGLTRVRIEPISRSVAKAMSVNTVVPPRKPQP